MSAVLWANYLLEDGLLVCDESDKYALYRHQKKLAQLTRKLGVTDFDSACDSTDAQVNMDVIELPDGMHSTRELMARDGVWINGDEAVSMLQVLLDALTAKPQRFGLLKDDYIEVMAELRESLDFARTAMQKNARFNFCIVM